MWHRKNNEVEPEKAKTKHPNQIKNQNELKKLTMSKPESERLIHITRNELRTIQQTPNIVNYTPIDQKQVSDAA